MAVDSSTVQVVMPAMGDSVAEGTVLEWHKQVGDTIAVDETLVEISTDKVDAEVPSPVAGTVLKIHAAEGDTVLVGGLLAEISAGDGEVMPVTGDVNGSAAAPATPVSAESPPATPEEALAGAATEAAGDAASAATRGETIDIVTPTGGESVTEGTILEWSVKVGDVVKDGDTVVEISTDKVDMELPAPASGTITEILANDGDTVTVGQVIARMTAADAAGASAAPPPTAPAVGAPPSAASAPPASTPDESAGSASPVARRIAAAKASAWPVCREAPAAGASPRPTFSPWPPTATVSARRRPIRARASRSGAARRCSHATWTRAARSPRRPRSAPSP